MEPTLSSLRHASLELPPAERLDAAVRDRCVLITGAGGSIGAELARRVRGCAPRRLVLLDHSETLLHELTVRLGDAASERDLRLVLADVRDRARVERLLKDEQPDIVLHAAAYKQVPLLETQPLAALSNNVLATRELVELAAAAGVERLVMTSTDKAVRPRSVLGATKRLAELILLVTEPAVLRTSSVRLVNVWGSRGSVLPRFERQLASGEPLTLTDEAAERYFITADEAVGVTLAALDLARGADLLVPRPGPPLAIRDIALRMLRQAGRSTDSLRLVGPRPGDKRSEELIDEEERSEPTACAGILRIVGPLPDRGEVAEWSRELEHAVRRADAAEALAVVCRALPHYRPSAPVLASCGASAGEGAGR